jgi:hypothetical protein
MLGNTTYRMHRFRTSASPVKGLTADILVISLHFSDNSQLLTSYLFTYFQMKVAEVAYAKPTVYERYAPGQLKGIVDVVKAIQNHEATLATA